MTELVNLFINLKISIFFLKSLSFLSHIFFFGILLSGSYTLLHYDEVFINIKNECQFGAKPLSYHPLPLVFFLRLKGGVSSQDCDGVWK